MIRQIGMFDHGTNGNENYFDFFGLKNWIGGWFLIKLVNLMSQV